MNTRKLLYVLGVLLVLVAIGAGTSMTLVSQAQYNDHGGVTWNADLDAALETAEEQSAPVALYFWSESCGACEEFSSEIKANGPPAEFDRYVLASVNVNEQQKLMNKYGVTTTPTVVVLTPTGDRVSEFNPLVVNDLNKRLKQVRMNTTLPQDNTK